MGKLSRKSKVSISSRRVNCCGLNIFHYIIWYWFCSFAKGCMQWSVLRSQEVTEERISSVDATFSTPASHQEPASELTDCFFLGIVQHDGYLERLVRFSRISSMAFFNFFFFLLCHFNCIKNHILLTSQVLFCTNNE